MLNVLGSLFGLYALYRAAIGRPISGRPRPAPNWNWIASGAITADKIRAGAFTANQLTAGTVAPINFADYWRNH